MSPLPGPIPLPSNATPPLQPALQIDHRRVAAPAACELVRASGRDQSIVPGRARDQRKSGGGCAVMRVDQRIGEAIAQRLVRPRRGQPDLHGFRARLHQPGRKPALPDTHGYAYQRNATDRSYGAGAGGLSAQVTRPRTANFGSAHARVAITSPTICAASQTSACASVSGVSPARHRFGARKSPITPRAIRHWQIS